MPHKPPVNVTPRNCNRDTFAHFLVVADAQRVQNWPRMVLPVNATRRNYNLDTFVRPPVAGATLYVLMLQNRPAMVLVMFVILQR